MRGNFFWAVLVIATALIEATWLQAIRVQGVVPNLVLLLVVFYAVSESEIRAMFTGLLGGIFQDVAADTGLGHHVLCLVLVGFFVGRVGNRLITDNPAVKAALVFFAILLHDFIYITIDYIQHVDSSAAYTMAIGMVPRAFYTALLTPIVFFVMSRTRVHDLWGSHP